MDARAEKLKALLVDVLDKIEPGSSAELNTPEKAVAVDAIAENLVKAFDILMDKPVV